jgi:hypothetical protein
MRKHFLKIFTIGNLFLLLVGCGPVYKTTYSYVPPKSWRARKCINRCLARKSKCQIQCRALDQDCVANAMDAARPAYRDYAHQQRRKHKPVYQSLQDFADTSNCHQNCQCLADYNDCYSNCGGRVISHTTCVAFCPKPKAKLGQSPKSHS